MIQDSHLQVFDLILEARSPVFIGTGKQYTKKEYLYDPNTGMVSILDEQKFFTYLAEHALADAYEGFILRERGMDLLEFLEQVCGIPRKEIDGFVSYQVYAGDALDQNHTLKEIHRFIRNSADQVYVPGSSIKGALRTALLKAALLQDSARKPGLIEDCETDLFHTLSLKTDRNGIPDRKNALNSILQGVRISDSLPIDNRQLCLTGKVDEFPDRSYNQINLCRESLRPGTRISCTLTLDQSFLKGRITADSICKAIAEASRFHQESVLARYPQAVNLMNSRTLLLGGGVGFQSKTILSPYYGDQALARTSAVLQRGFPRHHHEEDVLEGFSPRALKQTVADGVPHPYGVCEVTIR